MRRQILLHYHRGDVRKPLAVRLRVSHTREVRLDDLAAPPQRAAVRSGMSDGASTPPCGAESMSGALPATYSM